ncbi:MAG: tRNA pseudouridine32 synthase/23S rRNA pseudouridine746 synthase [Planctomycetota bacterium]|jgi:tRNA pseudouridine32 synthase/23S rRNA pseudouridine746 synthase
MVYGFYTAVLVKESGNRNVSCHCPILMPTLTIFKPQTKAIPHRLVDPFAPVPHPLAIEAADLLSAKLKQTPALSEGLVAPGQGKMFAVLVVVDEAGQIGYLSAFSGMLNQQWRVPGFVPPVFDVDERDSFLDQGEATLEHLSAQIDAFMNQPARVEAGRQLEQMCRQHEDEMTALKQRNKIRKQGRAQQRIADSGNSVVRSPLSELELASQRDKRGLKDLKFAWQEKLEVAGQCFERDFSLPLEQLKFERKRISQSLQQRVFAGYRLKNARGDTALLKDLFGDRTPTGGSADCAAPKLIHYAVEHRVKPLALAEFWWGGEPLDGVRHHRHFYPPCRGRCELILPFMLQGFEREPPSFAPNPEICEPVVVFEDEGFLVVEKPAGMLSIPGKQTAGSLFSWLQQRYPQAEGPLLVHRLDMATSGLLLVAKNLPTHKILQRQFIDRIVEKRYVALLEKPVAESRATIDLPLRVDLDDRPRQRVCHQHGKPAVTHMKVISSDESSTRVYFYPVTGRTHQLRVHAAHHLGLAAPIIGDALYGRPAQRLMLHAERLRFLHPVSGKPITFVSDALF